MGNLVETLRRNIDAAAIAIACLAVFAGNHAADRCRAEQEKALRVGVHRIWQAPARDAISAIHEILPACKPVFY